jgi:flagellar hook protein FlgE
MPITTSLTIATGAVTPLAFTFDLTGTTQYGASFGVNNLTQDGFTSGRLAGFNVSDEGIVVGRYTNGISRNLAQVVLADFRNSQGLKPLGGNQWEETSESGLAIVGAPNTGPLGVLQSAAVEDSNVDLTEELVNMITAQRVYQANAQTIKTQDQVLQTLVNLR